MRIGAFELERVIGKGGMGEVWSAAHVDQPVQVAIKLITAHRAREARFHDQFRGEVQSMARLHHRSVVLVLDYGRVGEKFAATTSGRVDADAPFLAMELADSSIDQQLREIHDWRALRLVLDQMLEALGHSHARGVLHRDLKPQNVLVFREPNALTYKLADFGLARPIAGGATPQAASGTPKYMAPEQILGDVREQGPWTDLYSLGCLAQWLASASPPFNDAKTEDVLRGHLLEEPPLLVPRVEVPEDFAEWVRVLLRKNPIDRFQTAADARAALASLEEPNVAAVGTVHELRESAETVLTPTGSATLYDEGETVITDKSTQVNSKTGVSGARRAFAATLDSPRESSGHLFPRSQAPESWHRPEPPSASVGLVGAGLGLHGLRPIPMVGRIRERDEVWRAVRDAREGTQIVILRGSAGSGKSRIAEWLGERAEETGAATLLRVVHSPIATATDGLEQMVKSHARVSGMSHSDAVARLQRVMSDDGRGTSFDAFDVVALADLVGARRGWASTASGSERRGVFKRFLAQVAATRPVYLWIDDAQWGREALELAAELADTPTLPIIVVLTVRDEALSERTAERALLKRLLEFPCATEVRVEPLDAADRAELVARMLRLEPHVAETVAARTQGNPLFAVQLVGDWVQRGVLRLGEGGFVVADAEAASLPDSIHHLWTRRVQGSISRWAARQKAVEATVEDAVAALQLATALGHEVEWEGWARACALCSLRVPDGLIDELVLSRLAEQTPMGWRFGHGMLRESLERAAREAGRFEAHHVACAQMLGEASQRDDLRIGKHLFAARQWEASLQPLFDAAESLSRRGEIGWSLEVDALREEGLDALGAPPHDPRRVIGSMRRARSLMLAGDYDAAAELIATAEALQIGPHERAELLWSKVVFLRHQNDTAQGAEAAAEALAAFRALGDDLGAARILKKLGELRRRLGDLAGSIEAYGEALAILELIDDPWERAWALLGLGTSQRHAYDLVSARINIEAAQAAFEALGNRLGLGNVHNELGELERALENYAEAERHYLEVERCWSEREHTDFSLLYFNRSLTLLPRGRYVDAQPLIERAGSAGEARGYRVLTMFAHAAMAVCAAGQRDLERARGEFGSFAELSRQVPIVEPDIVMLMMMLGELVAEHDGTLAREALTHALDQVERLGNEQRVRDVRSMLTALTCAPARG